jgi:uncharacterized protein YqiB (DUF1249 family)
MISFPFIADELRMPLELDLLALQTGAAPGIAAELKDLKARAKRINEDLDRADKTHELNLGTIQADADATVGEVETKAAAPVAARVDAELKAARDVLVARPVLNAMDMREAARTLYPNKRFAQRDSELNKVNQRLAELIEAANPRGVVALPARAEPPEVKTAGPPAGPPALSHEDAKAFVDQFHRDAVPELGGKTVAEAFAEANEVTKGKRPPGHLSTETLDKLWVHGDPKKGIPGNPGQPIPWRRASGKQPNRKEISDMVAGFDPGTAELRQMQRKFRNSPWQAAVLTAYVKEVTP